jgi:hypothetical protein
MMGSGDSRAQTHIAFKQLGGWPLPTMADGNALHVTRTKAFSAVGIQKTLESTTKRCLRVRSQKRKKAGLENQPSKSFWSVSSDPRSV